VVDVVEHITEPMGDQVVEEQDLFLDVFHLLHRRAEKHKLINPEILVAMVLVHPVDKGETIQVNTYQAVVAAEQPLQVREETLDVLHKNMLVQVVQELISILQVQTTDTLAAEAVVKVKEDVVDVEVFVGPVVMVLMEMQITESLTKVVAVADLDNHTMLEMVDPVYLFLENQKLQQHQLLPVFGI